MSRFLIAVLIGIGGTLAWQTHGEEAKQIVGNWATEMLAGRAPSLAGLLSSSSRLPPQVNEAATQSGSTTIRQVSADDSAVAQRASVAQTTAAPPAAAISPELAQQLEAMARDVDVVRRSIEQLAAKQEQIVQNIATLQAEIGHKLASPPVRPVVAVPSANARVITQQTAAPRPRPAPRRLTPSPAR